MADQTWAIGAAFGVQSGLGTVNSTVAGLSGTIDETDGCVLGHRDAGEFESGITIPTFNRIEAAVADVPGSFTRQAGSLERIDPTGLDITWQLKGNGDTATPSVGEAIPDPGILSLLRMCGLAGANGGSNAEYDLTPAASTTYGTSKLWVADLSFVLQDIIGESLELSWTGGQLATARAALAVGSHDPATQFADGVTFPTITYGNQSSLAAPLARGLSHTYGSARDFETLTVRLTNQIADSPASNQATGIRKIQNSRQIEISGVLYVDDGDSDHDYQMTVNSSANTADLTFQMGTPQTGAGVMNAYLINANNIQLTEYKPVKRGTATAVQFSGYCAATSAGGEFLLQQN